jgi:hypothetical protein
MTAIGHHKSQPQRRIVAACCLIRRLLTDQPTGLDPEAAVESRGYPVAAGTI